MDVHDRPVRFRDPKVWLYDLATENIAVVCPRCRSRALVITEPVDCRSVLLWPRRLVCPACAYAASWDPKTQESCWGGPVDPFFRLPLWLRAECRGGTLWACNRAHLDLLEDYVAARLRERGGGRGWMTLVARLPAWIKSAKNRDEVLAAITRLRVPGRARDAAAVTATTPLG